MRNCIKFIYALALTAALLVAWSADSSAFTVARASAPGCEHVKQHRRIPKRPWGDPCKNGDALNIRVCMNALPTPDGGAVRVTLFDANPQNERPIMWLPEPFTMAFLGSSRRECHVVGTMFPYFSAGGVGENTNLLLRLDITGMGSVWGSGDISDRYLHVWWDRGCQNGAPELHTGICP